MDGMIYLVVGRFSDHEPIVMAAFRSIQAAEAFRERDLKITKQAPNSEGVSIQSCPLCER